MPELIDMKVIGTQAVCEDVMAVELERADGGPLPTWSPGSHIDIELAAGLVRQYSLCSDPRLPRTWQIAVRREPRSRGGSDFVHDQLAPGAVLRATVPINRFAFEDADAYVFIAGGIGITPLLPMLRQAWWRKKPARVYYLGRSRGRLPFIDIVEELCDDVTVHESATAGRRDIAADLTGLPAGPMRCSTGWPSSPNRRASLTGCTPSGSSTRPARGSPSWPMTGSSSSRRTPEPR